MLEISRLVNLNSNMIVIIQMELYEAIIQDIKIISQSTRN